MFRAHLKGKFTLQMSKDGKNNPHVLAFVPFYSPTKKVHFFNYFRKVVVMTDIFVFISNVFIFCSTAFWIITAIFLGNVKNGLFSKITSQWHHRYAQHTSKDALLSSGSEDVFTDSLAHSGRELWPIITSKGTIVAVSDWRVLRGWEILQAQKVK